MVRLSEVSETQKLEEKQNMKERRFFTVKLGKAEIDK